MSPRGKEKNEKMRAETLAIIKSAALEVFAEYGYHGATMKKIAEVSNLSYGLVYHYFPSKEKIFLHLLDFALDSSLFTLSTAIDSPGTAWEKIEKLSTILIQNVFTGENSLYFLLVQQAMTQRKGIPGLLKHIEVRLAAYYEKLIPVIIQAQKSGEAIKGDPAALAAAYFSLVQGLVLLVFQEKGLEKKITPDILSGVLQNKRGKIE